MKGTPVVTSVEVVAPFTLEVQFRDGECRRVDLSKNLKGEVFRPLRDPEFFAKVFVDPISHTVAWPNGADLAPEWLYEPDEEKYWGKEVVG
jgi:hypothetical protein